MLVIIPALRRTYREMGNASGVLKAAAVWGVVGAGTVGAYLYLVFVYFTFEPLAWCLTL
jgi:hypothetical protein